MARKDVDAIVSGAGWIGGFAEKLSVALRKRGASSEDIHKLVTDGAEVPVGKIADVMIEFMSVGEISETRLAKFLVGWGEFYQKHFSLDKDFSGLRIPRQKEGFDRLIVVAAGMTPEKIFSRAKSLIPAWKYWNNLDEIISGSDRKADHDYVIWTRDRQEADEELKNKSADDLKQDGISGITLEERLLYELKFFDETGKHLDVLNITLCAGSRDSLGYVPGVYWDGGEMRVRWCLPNNRRDGIHARAVVS